MRARLDPVVLAAALPTLMAAHDVADHVVQTDHQAGHKAGSWSAMAGHLAGYHALQVGALAALRAAGVRPSWRRTAAAVAWSAATHGFLDRRWPVLVLLRLTGSQRFSRPLVRVEHEVDGYGRASTQGAPTNVTAVGPLPLHGPYLADQALHHAALWVAAVILAWRTK